MSVIKTDRTATIIAVIILIAAGGVGAYLLYDHMHGGVSYNYEAVEPASTISELTPLSDDNEYLVIQVTVKNVNYRNGDNWYEVDLGTFYRMMGTNDNYYLMDRDATLEYNMETDLIIPGELKRGESTSFYILFDVPKGVSIERLYIDDDVNKWCDYVQVPSLV